MFMCFTVGMLCLYEMGICMREFKNIMLSRVLRKEIIVLIAGAVLFGAGITLNLPFYYELLLFGSSYIITGGDILLKAFKNITKGRIFDENFLMGIATLGAFAIHEFPEAAAVMLFFKAGELIEDIAVDSSKKSIKSLMDIRPEYANLSTPGGLMKVNPADVDIGDVIVVKPGERVPLDGTVLAGESYIDASALTGESVPRPVNPGGTILSGSINTSSSLTVKVTKNFAQSTVSRILELVQSAAAKKAPVESFITKFARYYTPFVVIAALLIAVIPPVIQADHDFGKWAYRALIFLVISCPCAFVISVPLSFFGGIGGASKKGILVKGSNYLEALNNIDTVVFDKTGTLTKGVFKVNEIVAENGFSKEDVLELAAIAEIHSNHPIAKSILESYGKDINMEEVEAYEEIGGHGVRAVTGGREIFAGNARLLHSIGFTGHDDSRVQGSVVHVVVDNVYAGCIVISDSVKEDSAKTVSELKMFGVSNIIMLTGDNRHAAENVGKALGVDKVYSELLPHQKVEQLEKIQESIKSKTANGRKKLLTGMPGTSKPGVLFAGDGINDAPVIARADIGVAMGALGSDAAIEASDIVLMTDEPSKLVEAINVARKTRKIVWQNILFAFAVKLIVLALGAGGLTTMWKAVFADVGVTLIAVLNSLRAVK